MKYKVLSVFLIFFLIACDVSLSDKKTQQVSITQVSNFFTFKLFKLMAINNVKDNIVASPESILSVSSMLWLGASQETRKQLTQALFADTTLDINESFICNAYKKMHIDRNELKQTFTINQTNGLWVEKKFKIKSSYKNKLKQCFHSELRSMNVNQPSKVAKEINTWVKQNTQGMIPNLLAPDNITSNTKAVIVNTLYFKATWDKPFQKHNTVNLPFYTKGLHATETKTNMMTDKSANYQYTKNSKWQVLAKEYAGGDAALIVLLPQSGKTLSDVLKNTKDKEFMRLIHNLRDLPRNTLIDLQLPKYETETTSQLIPLFQQLGVVNLFSPKKADLSNITNNRLFVNVFLQKAKVQVDEDGTTAAAATVAIMARFSGKVSSLWPPTVIKFHANHPFIYLVYDKQHQQILFIGQYVKPSN